ncbi:discoidin domain-containing protein [Paenibacillus sp. CC-CFT747]|nr:discoidin domain-containing protein [Paenibacillus sp. CC-CFT747]
MGYVNNDPDGTQAVGSWAYKGAAAMDYQNRSVGINLGSPTRVSQLELADSNTDSRGTLADYKLYYSDDNAAWTPVEMSGVRFDSRMEQGRTLHRFTFAPVKAQFFKVNSLYSDSSWKWQLTNLQRDVKAYGPGSELGGQLGFTRIGYLDEDANPESSPMRNWGHSADLALDYNGRSLGMDMGSIKTVGAVTLTDSNSAARGDKTSYSVYTSSDDSRYTLIPSEQIRWSQTLIDNRLVYTIGFEQPLTTRYLKIHTNYRDSDFSFVLSGAARSQIRVYAPPAANQPGPADPTRLETPYPIGSATQLFVSRDLVESTNQVSWQVIAGQKSPDPIIEVGPGDEWRYIMGGDVIYNAGETDTKFEMWYMVQNTNNNSISSYYAKSPDGLHWERSPDYKLTVNGTPFSAYSASVRKDPDAPAAERYKMAMFNFASSAGQYYTSTLISPNGIEWTYKNQRAVLGYDFAITVWDRFRQEYVMMTKSNESDPGFGNRLRRIFHTSTSSDFEQWTPTIKSLEADAIDNNFASIAERYDRAKPIFETPLDRGFMRADIYATAFYPHESGMIGFPLVHYINNKNPQKGDDDGVSEVQLAFSRDQRTWQRDFREPVLPTGTARIHPDLPSPLPRDNAAVSDWDSGWMYTAMHALDVGNEVWMYYNGSNTTHAADAIYNSAWRYDPDTNPSGVYTWEIGLAKWQKGRFVSVHTPASGTVTTKPVLFEGNTLVINARTGAGGSVRAEILDRENRVLVPLSEAVTGDTFSGTVRFAGQGGIGFVCR